MPPHPDRGGALHPAAVPELAGLPAARGSARGRGRDALRAALAADNDPRFLIQFLRQSKQRSEEVWSIELVYYVKQTA